MDFLTNFDWSQMTPMKALKLIGIGLGVLLVLAIGIQIVGSTFRGFSDGFGVPGMAVAPSYGGMGGGDASYDAGNYAREESMASMPQLSARNVMGATMYPPQPMSPSGDTAEEFEVTQYSAHIETRKREETCAGFDELKSRSEVIFENANTYDGGCNFTFKVKHDSVESVLAWLRDLDPKELSENTYTIKRQIDDFTNEVEVLEKKRASIDQTLAQALVAYDEITRLATRTDNAEALASIINSKINIIERLTQERININEQLDRLARAKAEQLDRLDYTYFNVSVVERKYIDGEELLDSWKRAVSATINDVNRIVQEATLGLLALLFLILQWLIYAFIALLVIKYGWKVGKSIWFR